MAAQRKPPQERNAGRAEPVKRAPPLDDEALRQALGEAHASASVPEAGARTLQQRAAAALSGQQAEADPNSAAVAGEATWPLRRQLLFITLASALCWAVVLVPLALVF